MGDAEEVAKLKENAEIAAKLEEWSRRKEKLRTRVVEKESSNPRTALKPGTVLTPEQIAARFGTRPRKAPSLKTNPDTTKSANVNEKLAQQIPDGPARLQHRNVREQDFESSLFGSKRSSNQTTQELDPDEELQEYKAGQFAQVQQRRLQMQRQRENGGK